MYGTTSLHTVLWSEWLNLCPLIMHLFSQKSDLWWNKAIKSHFKLTKQNMNCRSWGRFSLKNNCIYTDLKGSKRLQFLDKIWSNRPVWDCMYTLCSALLHGRLWKKKIHASFFNYAFFFSFNNRKKCNLYFSLKCLFFSNDYICISS